MKRRAIFFDRDNTLIKCGDYLGDCSKVVLADGAPDAVARARKLGYATVVFSNQSGVARGYFTEEAVHAVNARMDEMLAEGNPQAVIDRHEFCPFHPEASIEKYRQESPLRKPAPGMILAAADALALDLPNSWVIGDAPRDIAAGHAAGCRTILYTDANLSPSAAAGAEKTVEPDYVVSTLNEAIDYIERQCDVVLRPPENAPAPLAPISTEPLVSSRPNHDDDHAKTQAAVERTVELPAPPRDTITPPNDVDMTMSPSARTDKVETLLVEILREMRRAKEAPHNDFSVSKLLAGVAQVLVLAVLFVAYLNRADPSLVPMLFALVLQAMTIALLIMGRQR